MLKVGFAKTGISTSQGAVHDPLYVKALVLSDGVTVAALVSVDTICFGGGIGEVPDSFFPRFREDCAAMGVTQTICGATHTHTPGKMICPPEELQDKARCTVRNALDALEPAVLGIGEAHDPSFAVNRTLILKDSSAWSIRQAHPCPPDREIGKLDGYDDTVTILKADRPDGSALCTLFTFGCHPLLGYASNAATANYPGVAERVIREQTGGEAIFFQACGGDVTEIDYKNYEKPKCCEGPGISLALAVLKARPGIPTGDAVFRTTRREAVFPRRTDIPQYRAALEKERDALVRELADCPLNFKAFLPLYIRYLTGGQYPLGYKYDYLHEEALGSTQLRDQDAINRRNIKKYLHNTEIMERLSKIGSTLDTLDWHEAYNRGSGSDTIRGEICVLAFGDTAFVTLPVEPLSRIGMRIREASPFGRTAVIGYANGYMHYGPPAESYRNGGYETIECFLGDGWEAVAERAVADALASVR